MTFFSNVDAGEIKLKNNGSVNMTQSKDEFKSYLAIESKDRNAVIIERYMKTKEKDYCDYETLKMFCGTYNVNGQSCLKADLSDWLSHQTMKEPPDIYAIGFQELDRSQQAFVFSDSPKEHEWVHCVKRALHPDAHYKELKRVRLVGIFLLIFVKKGLQSWIKDSSIDCNTVPTGLLNILGNKGGVGIRFQMHDSHLCFVASHLAAGPEELLRRNQDFREICKMKFFQNNAIPYKPEVFNHDLIFWLGDLNYRLQSLPDKNLDIEDVKMKCKARYYDELLTYDQLYLARKQSQAFNEFEEGPISFAPTYKYDTGTDNWDSSEKCRAPAWTDRILWKGDDVMQLHYNSVPDLRISDHKPVFSLFQFEVKKIDQQRYKTTFESALKMIDRLENEYLPQAVIDKCEFRFEQVKFLEPQSQSFTLKNVGKVPVDYNIETITEKNETADSWIIITPDSFQIKIEEKLEVTVTVLVDKLSVGKATANHNELAAFLVLHLVGGKDYFLSVSLSFVPTCFGRSLTALVGNMNQSATSTPAAPTTVPTGQLIDLGTEEPILSGKQAPPVSATTPPQLTGVPRELYRLVDHLLKNGLGTADLFDEPGSQTDFVKIRDALDAGGSEPIPGSVYSVLDTLLRFLDALPEPVIPAKFTELCIRHCNDWPMCKKIIEDLPACHRNVFFYVVDFLKQLKSKGHINGCTAISLASMFAPFLIKTEVLPQVGRKDRSRVPSDVQFLQNFILEA